jgi:predicted transcriptional regulator
MIEKRRGRGELQAITSVPSARQSGRVRRRRTSCREQEAKPSEIARAVGRSVPRVSNVLGALRLADVVRYDSDGKRNYYWLKHPSEIRQVLVALSRVVKAASKVAARHR